ncbi:hypothetical protein SAMN05444365_10648 [Micromonospora pattaloongensis]|uniref:Uncharacterized protein n=1 Tax=Micromonospora pattaloongensis TaxID=405436 RepID=A0A1H3QNZ0_9ACTN|nr:hypothetical protein [Micromonospora pattaloongensis]SDZ15264.1 hypothetical protein SAMN05444365_10648 [Micromonospora pattaloongensis]
MNGIDKNTLDEVVAKTFKELKTAIDTHSEKSIEMYSLALRALVKLRAQVIAEDRTDG